MIAQSLRRCSLVDSSRSAGVVDGFGGFGNTLGALLSGFWVAEVTEEGGC